MGAGGSAGVHVCATGVPAALGLGEVVFRSHRIAIHQKAILHGPAQQNIPLFLVRMKFVGPNEPQWILERRRGFIEPYPMLPPVPPFLAGIPLEDDHNG